MSHFWVNHECFHLEKKWECVKPTCCHKILEWLQSRTQWRKVSFWRSHLVQIVDWAKFMWLSKERVGTDLWQANQNRNLIFSGNCNFQIQIQEEGESRLSILFERAINQEYPLLVVWVSFLLWFQMNEQLILSCLNPNDFTYLFFPLLFSNIFLCPYVSVYHFFFT